MKPRWKRCVENTDELLGEALGKKYTDKYFPPAAKARMQELVKNLRGAMADDIRQLDWMGPETKKKALEKLADNPGIAAYNLGTGRGTSVLEMVDAFTRATGNKIPYSFRDRRPGDAAECYSDPSKAERELGWRAVRDINDMCRDTWNWQVKNPNGYVD
jgi:dTDP-D-glucose 4,6-dehydratase